MSEFVNRNISEFTEVVLLLCSLWPSKTYCPYAIGYCACWNGNIVEVARRYSFTALDVPKKL